MLNDYWPLEEEVSRCIRDEAEELPDHVLMAVHEPMILEKKLLQTGETEVYRDGAESAVLENVKKSERPVPILGDSGTGKSHLIRLLDIKLRNDPDTKDWIVRRIPKSASLREVLSILLDGLEGELFESARKRIKDVGQQLKPREVAEHLIVFMGHRLQEKYDALRQEIMQIKQSGGSVTQEKKKEFDVVRRHAASNALPALLGDSNYKETLINDNGCIYQIAKRLTSGSSEDELIENNYQLTPDDLDFNLNLGDLSRSAREYVNAKSLNTILERRQEAVGLLNEVISEACNKVFQHLFQLHGGNFLDLFVEIRRYLKGKTLVILVEDMSLITAIEGDLITSLTREGIRDGNEEMCVVKSAIAVTTGYEGYARHRNSIVGRNSGYEWHILKEEDDTENLSRRIQDFCGRYLNAARYGSKNLKIHFDNFMEEGVAYPIWQASEQDVLERSLAFGTSPSGFPLFPFNKASLNAFIYKFCRDVTSNTIIFNPRIVLKHFLIEKLTVHRRIYLDSSFPPIGFGGFDSPSGLAGEIKRNVHKDIERSLTLASIWGFGATKLGELSSILQPDVAREFGLDEFATCLEGTAPTPLTIPPTTEGGSTTPKDPSPKPKVKEQIDVNTQIATRVEKFFEIKAIDQKTANTLRQSLLTLLINHASSGDILKWHGVKAFPDMRRAKIPQIYIPYNANNPAITIVSFGSEQELARNPLHYKSFIIALLRHEHHQSWDYEGGYYDYCEYQNFTSEWVPKALRVVIDKEREKLKEKLREHLELAVSLEPSILNKSNLDKVAHLTSSKEAITEKIQKSGVHDWDALRDKLVGDWSEKQKNWLTLISINNHAIEGDIVLKAMHGLTIETIPYSREVQKVQQYIKSSYSSFALLMSITTKDDYLVVMDKLLLLIQQLSSHNQYKNMDNQLTAKQLINRVKKVCVGEYWEVVKSTLGMFEPFEVKETITSLNHFNEQKAKEVAEVLSTWSLVYKANLQRMKNENRVNGGDARIVQKKELDSKLHRLSELVQYLRVREGQHV